MRVCRFEHEGGLVFGEIEGDSIHVLDGCPVCVECVRTGTVVALAETRLLAPVEPPNIVAIGTNYQSHVDETNSPVPERPLVFLKATTSLCGPGDAILLPRICPEQVDYEGELAIIIGRTARHVSEESALDHVFGYACANDVSQRLCQKKLDRQWARAKSFDTFCPLGPWIETEVDDPQDLGIRTILNGETLQDSRTSHMIFGIRTLISYLSDAMTLLPGTVILTGTPEGVGMARNPEVYLADGDTVRVEIEGLGSLVNPVVAE